MNGTYFLWMLGSLSMNLTLRRLGFYAGRVLLETSIPAQITAFAYGAMKISYLIVDMYLSGFPLYSGLLASCAFVATVSLAAASAFLTEITNTYDLVVSLGSYYLWVICYALPLAVCVVNAGVNYTISHYIILTLVSALISMGVFAHTYHRMEMITNNKDKELVVPPPSKGNTELKLMRDISEENTTLDLRKLYIEMDAENLLDAEIIDEDSLINNIRDIV
jgi:hypothetical protein